MKEMRLFEVGLKDKPHSISYLYKYYVAAENAADAERKARQFIIEDHKRWWEREGKLDAAFDVNRELKSAELDAELQSQLDGCKDLHLAKLLDIGTLIV